MIGFGEFVENVKSRLLEYLADESIENIEISEVLKNNGVTSTALILKSSELNISPTIYMENFYEEFLNGRPLNSIVISVADSYRKNKPLADFDLKFVQEYDKAKEQIIRMVCNYDENIELLKTVPHKKISDLAVIYRLKVPREYENYIMEDDSYSTILINNKIMSNWNVSVEDLDQVAKENTKKNNPPAIISMFDYIMEPFVSEIMDTFMLDEQAAKDLLRAQSEGLDAMYIVTNDVKIHGAVHILDEEVMDILAEKIGKEFYVIPSSIHEVIAIPYGIRDPDEIREMIEEVNNDCLDEKEQLSDKLYYVDAERHLFCKVEDKALYMHSEKAFIPPNGPKL